MMKLRAKLAPMSSVVTWNMQGGGGNDLKIPQLRAMMGAEGVDVICLQECGHLFGWVNADLPGDWRIGLHREWAADPIGGNPRCSLAILTNREVLDTKTWEAEWAAGRPLIGIHLRGMAAYSIHAPAGGNNAYVNSAIAAVSLQWYGANWILAGDFNLAPAHRAGGTLARSGYRTCGHRELDYGYWSGFTDVATGQAGALISDHYAVKFDITHPRLRGG